MQSRTFHFPSISHPFSRWNRMVRWAVAGPALAVLLAACGGGDEPSAEERAAWCRTQVNDTQDSLVGCVTVEAVRAHIATFTDIAMANGGSRAAGTPGYDASVRHVEGLLRAAGYAVTVQPFTFETHALTAPSVLEQRAPAAAVLAHETFKFSGNGDVTAALAAPAAAIGCAAGDFAGFPAGSIALVSRGACAFEQKATHAFQAGAVAMVVHNQAEGPIDGHLGAAFRLPLPVLGVSRAAGDALLARMAAGSVVLHARVDGKRTTSSTVNLLAETTSGDPDHVVVAGAHFDTVEGTVGSNDNASGAAALLETALQMARVQPRQKVRFAFWGGEEAGLFGSDTYVERLSAVERARIDVYLNFDMIASPNYIFGLFVGNGEDEDGSPLPGTGGAIVQKVFTSFYESLGLPWRLIGGADGRSDHAAFSEAGIPFGGLFTGAEEIKTAQDAALWGGTPGVAYDACYHLACDDMSNLNLTALAVNADLVAASVLHFAANGLRR